MVKMNKSYIKQAIINGVCVRFTSANHTPMRSSDMVDFLGILGEMTEAKTIMKGSWVPLTDLLNDTWDILLSMRRNPTVESPGDINIEMSRYYFRHHWKISKDVTSSSIYGLHFSHYKAVSRSNFISEVHSICCHLCANLGLNAPIWLMVLQVVMLKVTGKFLLYKLRGILLMDCD